MTQQNLSLSLFGTATFTILMGIFLGLSQKLNASIDSLFVSFIRVLMNGFWVFALFMLSPHLRKELRRVRPNLKILCWGFCGALTVHSYMYAVMNIGMGLATLLLQCFQVLTVALISAALFKKKLNLNSFLAIIFSIVGLIFLQPNFSMFNLEVDFNVDLFIGSLAGVFAGIAYSMLSGTRGIYSTSYVMFYWTIFCLGSHLMVFVFDRAPEFILDSEVYLWVLLAGIMAAGAQFLTSGAYQLNQTFKVTLLFFLVPVLCLMADFIIFHTPFSPQKMLGICMIVGSMCFQVLYRNPERSRN